MRVFTVDRVALTPRRGDGTPREAILPGFALVEGQIIPCDLEGARAPGFIIDVDQFRDDVQAWIAEQDGAGRAKVTAQAIATASGWVAHVDVWVGVE